MKSTIAIKVRSLEVSLFFYVQPSWTAIGLIPIQTVQSTPPFGASPQLIIVNGWWNWPGMSLITGLMGF